MRKLIYLVLIVSLCLNLSSQNTSLYQVMKNRNEFYFSFKCNNLQSLQKISDVVSVDKVDGNDVVAYANNQEYERFLTLGLEHELQTPPSMSESHKMYDGKCRAEYAWDEYPTYDAYESMMYEYAESYPEKCSLMELGVLESGRKILLLRINDGETECDPKVLLTSTIHGDETTGFVMMLRLIDELLSQEEGADVDNIVKNIDLFICPNANPDGTYKMGNNTVDGATRYNASGVDMNRNYPDKIKGSHPDDKDYALETEMFMRLAEEYQFTISANYHGGAELVNYPWDNDVSRHVDDEWWQMISRQYAGLAQKADSSYMIDRNVGVTNGADWYKVYGGRQDYMNYYQRCRELTVECSTIKCPSANELPLYWDYNRNAIFAFISQALNGIHGTVKDTETNEPLSATIRILDYDEDYSVVESQLPYGDFHRPLMAGNYTVEVSSDGYVPVRESLTLAEDGSVNLDVRLRKMESYNMKSGTVKTTEALFYDSGGPDANYPDNDFHVMTFYPEIENAMIQVEFLEFSTEEKYDIIRVYDGTSVGEGHCVGILSGTSIPEPITATNAQGALTFRFLSDYATNDKGWKAVIRCMPAENVGENDEYDVVSIFPNPAKNVLNVKLNDGGEFISWVLYDAKGQIVMKSLRQNRNDVIDVSNLGKGMYFLTIDVDGKHIVKKVIL